MGKPSKKGAKSEAEVAAEAKRKKEILDQVAQSNLPTKTILKELGISRSTYYSWLKRYEEGGENGLLDSRSLPRAEEEIREATPPAAEAEPQITEVESVEKAVEETPPERVAETVKEAEPTPPTEEEYVDTPEEPLAAPAREEPERREEVVRPSETVTLSGGEKKKGLGIYALIAILLLVLGLLFSVSLSHYNSYQLRETDNTLTLWKGRFAARGFEMVESFDPLEVGDSDVSALTNRTFTKKDELNMAIYTFLMDQINAEVAKGTEADTGKIDLLLAKAEDAVGADAKGSKSLADIRFQLAEKRVAIAEMELKEAYERALPAYEEAARMGLGDVLVLEAKIAAMQKVLRGVSEGEVEAESDEEAQSAATSETTADEAEISAVPEVPAGEEVAHAEPEKSDEEAVTPVASEEHTEGIEVSGAVEKLEEEAESPVKPEATSEEAGTAATPIK
jgi:transposase-like protein